MKCCYYLIDENGNFSRLVIDKSGAYFDGENMIKQNLKVNSQDCINTLISLYSLKRNWEKEECYLPVCKVSFGENEEDYYEFETSNLPDNWPLFLGFLNRLVGDAI